MRKLFKSLILIFILVNLISCQKEKSKSLSYDVVFKGNSDLKIEPFENLDTKSMFNLKGKWYFQKTNESEYISQFVSEKLEFTYNNLIDKDIVKRIKREVNLPFKIYLGEEIKLEFQHGITNAAKNLIKSLVSKWQFKKGNKKNWQNIESDLTSLNMASYVKEGNSVRKKLKPISKKQLMDNDLPYNTTIEGTQRFTFEKDILNSVDGEYNYKFIVNDKKIGHSNIYLSMNRIDMVRKIEGHRLSSKKEKINSGTENLIYRTQLRKKNINLIIDKLKNNIDASSELWEENYSNLKAIIALHPETLETFENILLSTKADSKTSNVIIRALTVVSTKDTIKSIMRAFEETQSQKLKLNLLVNLFNTKDPSDFLIDWVMNIFDNNSNKLLRKTAGSVLSIFSNKLKYNSKEKSYKIAKKFIKRFQKGGHNNQKYFLMLMGNSGSDLAFPFIKELVEKKDDKLLAKAIRALRFINKKEAKSICNNHSKDKNKEVRVQAEYCLSFYE